MDRKHSDTCNPGGEIELRSGLGFLYSEVSKDLYKKSPFSPVPAVPTVPQISCFFKLPLELVTEVFALACHDDTIDFFSDSERHRKITPFILGHVCVRWRVITLSTPGIWSRVSLCLSIPRYHAQMSLLSSWLWNSGTYPLTINLIVIDEDEEEWLTLEELPMELLKMLASTSHRWHSIAWVLPQSWSSCLTEIMYDLPLLTTLKVQAFWIDSIKSNSEQMPFDIFQAAPALKSVTMNGYGGTTVHLSWNRLTKLDLSRVTHSLCLWVLKIAPQLVDYSLKCILDPDDVDLATIESKSLQTLHISDSAWSEVVDLLSDVCLPTLQILAFYSLNISHTFPDISFCLETMKRSNLTHLKLWNLSHDFAWERELVKFMDSFTSIRNLTIGINNISQNLFCGHFFEMLRARVSQDPPGRAYYPLPYLEHFTFSGPVEPRAFFHQSLFGILPERYWIAKECENQLKCPLKSYEISGTRGFEFNRPLKFGPVTKKILQKLVDDGLRAKFTFEGVSLV